jgi:hypothetical protein
MANLKDLRRDMLRTKAKIAQQTNIALDQTAKKAISMAKLKSSGTYSYEDLAEMGHPYAERHSFTTKVEYFGKSKRVTFDKIPPKSSGYPYGDRRVINKQSGEFYNSWYQYESGMTPMGIRLIGIHNTAWYATLLEHGIAGLTVSREIDQHIIKRIEEVLPNLVKKALDKSMQIIASKWK